MNLKYFFVLISLAAIWGSSFTFIKIGTPEFGAAPLMFFRIAIASILLLVVLLYTKGHKNLQLKHILPLGIAGVTGQSIPFFLLNYAEHTLSASLTSILNASTPFWTALIMWLALKEQMNKLQIFGLIVGFLGVVFLMVQGKNVSLQGASNMTYTFAVIAVLIATFSYGVSSSYIKKNLQGMKSIDLAAGSTIVATLVSFPFALIEMPNLNTISAEAWWSVIALGVVCSGIAFTIFFYLILKVGPTNAVSVTFLIPIFGVIWGIIILDDTLTIEMVISTAVILFGVMLSTKLISFPLKQ